MYLKRDSKKPVKSYWDRLNSKIDHYLIAETIRSSFFNLLNYIFYSPKRLKLFIRAIVGGLKRIAKIIFSHSRGDKVFSAAMVLIFMATVLISATFFNLQLESSKEAKRVEAIFATSIRNKEAQPRLKVLGVKNVEVKTAPEKQVRVPILMYHHVSDTFREGDPWAPRLTVSTTNFRAQMNYLKDAGYVTVGFDDLYRSLYINKPLPPKSVIITFDDGFADNYEYAYPILKQNKQTATFFVMSNFFNQDDYMTANQVKEMSDDGMSIESHTVNHAKLSALSGAELRHELSDSKKLIEKIINKPIYFLAYPYGSHTEETKEASQRAGYFLAVTTLSGSTQSSHDPFGLYRIAIPAHSQLDVDWFAKAIN